MIIVDKANNINKPAVLAEVAQYANRPTEAVAVLAKGTVTGAPKLEMSLDGVNFIPLLDDEGEQVELTAGVPVFLESANVWVKVDLTGVTSSDLIVEIQ